MSELCADLKIPPLQSYGLNAADIPVLSEKAAQASSMKGNPLALLPAERENILAAALR